MRKAFIQKLGNLMAQPKPKKIQDLASDVKYVGLKKAPSSMLSYSRRHRGEWFKPEYDFAQIQIAQHQDSFILRGVKKKCDRFLVAGYELVGKNDDPVQYVKNRIRQIEFVSNRPFLLTLRQTIEDLERYSNCMWVKVRSTESSSGEKRKDLSGKELEPVAAYYILPFSDLEFKTKVNGEIKKVRQVGNDGEVREWSPSEIVHFYTDMKAGFTVGTPSLLPAIEDVALLRRIEENVEELIETHLFPIYHYKIGTDNMPQRVTREGLTESEWVKKQIEYMPPGSIYVTDHRHEIEALGSEGKALSIESYLNYFRQRALVSIGTTEVDLGISGQSNRSTANTLSKTLITDVEALQVYMKTFIDFYVIQEILLEGGYDPFDPENHVEINFGIIDREERMALENQQINMFNANLRNLNEVRAVLGDKPVEPGDEWVEQTAYKLFTEPLAMIKATGTPGSAAAETLAGLETSNITPEAVNKSKQFAKEQEKAAAKARAAGQGRPASKGSSSSRSASSKSRPSNQHGTRSSPKLNRDVSVELDGNEYVISVSRDISDEKLEIWQRLIEDRWEIMKGFGVKPETVIDNMLERLVDD